MIYLEKIKQYATSNGVSDFLLGNQAFNILKYKTFEGAGVPSGTEVDYLAIETKFNQWESGTGIYTNIGTPSLSRITIEYSSLGENIKINFINPPLISVNPIRNVTSEYIESISQEIETSIMNTVEDTYAPLVSPTFTNNPAAPTPTSGDSSTLISTTAFVQGELNKNPFGQCRLYRSETSTLKLIPWNGNRILINGVLQTIPYSGVSLTLSGLSIGSNYNVYAYWTGTAIAIEAVVTEHITDATYGIEVKTGDASRTLVGMIRAIASNDTDDSELQRFVINWFNRQPLSLSMQLTTDPTTSSTTLYELDGFCRPSFICWYNTIVFVSFFGYGWISGGDGTDFFFAQGRVDGSIPDSSGYAVIYDNGNGDAWAHTGAVKGMSEGYHFLAGYGGVNNSNNTAHFGAGTSCRPVICGWFMG